MVGRRRDPKITASFKRHEPRRKIENIEAHFSRKGKSEFDFLDTEKQRVREKEFAPSPVEFKFVCGLEAIRKLKSNLATVSIGDKKYAFNKISIGEFRGAIVLMPAEQSKKFGDGILVKPNKRMVFMRKRKEEWVDVTKRFKAEGG